MKRILMWGGIGLVALIIIAAISGGGSSKNSQSQSPSPTTVQQAQQNYVFDVPSLVGKNVDEAIAVLQPYKKNTLEPTEEQIRLGVKDWDVEFEKDGKSLLVNYDIATRKVNNFFISTDDPSGATKDKGHLLELGNLKEYDARYKVGFVKALKDQTVFTGVKITIQ